MLNRLAFKVNCLDVAYPEPPRRHVYAELQGRCPFSSCRYYGSEDGAPFYVKLDGSSWRCTRCRTGGDGIDAIAIKAGIIQCKEARRPLTKKEESQLKQIIEGLKNER